MSRGAAAGSPGRALALPPGFAATLLSWFDEQRRDLPWRGARTPYAVLVSEVMLQQTTVAAAVPGFRRFMGRFPSLSVLAAAPLADVLATWAGLGYYRRARSLHATARAVVALHDGRLPADREALCALPGLGPYTVGAVLSLAFGQPAAAVDGNVARVLSRHVGRALAASRTSDRRQLEALVLAAQPAERPGDFNEALMELGATACSPRAPACGTCPVTASCTARREERQQELLPPAARPAQVQVTAVAALVRSKGRVLLQRRDEAEAVLPGFWELPSSVVTRGDPGRHLTRHVLPALGGGRVVGEACRVRHVITTRRITLHVLECELAGLPPISADLRFVTPARARSLALATATARALALVDPRAPLATPGPKRRPLT